MTGYQGAGDQVRHSTHTSWEELPVWRPTPSPLPGYGGGCVTTNSFLSDGNDYDAGGGDGGEGVVL